MIVRAFLLLGLCCWIPGCSGDVKAPVVANPANGVLISVVVPGRSLAGGRDPVSSEATTLALETLTNTRDAAVFLAMCGGSPGESRIDNEDGGTRKSFARVTLTQK